MAGAPEDNYEAVLRAADALFSGSAGNAIRRETPPPSFDLKPSASFGGLFETEPSDAVWKPDEVFGDPRGTEQPDLEQKSSGRVLRALDEPPPPELVALEAERAPKRRGRKPGSKNKPKVPFLPVADDDTVDDTTHDVMMHDATTHDAMTNGAVAAAATATISTKTSRAKSTNGTAGTYVLAAFDEVEDADFAQDEVGAVAAPVQSTAPRRVAAQQASAGQTAAATPRPEKFAWVRVKLKPGERWKRHLPKVVW